VFEEVTLEELMSLADDAANLAARNYVGIDAEDISSAIMEIVCRNPERIERHLEHKGWLWSVFYGEAVRYCNEQVATFQYYTGEHFYTPQEVRDLLKAVFEGEIDLDDYVYVSDAAVSVWDLNLCFEKLSFKEKDLLSRRYRNREVLTESDRRACNRAIDRLTRKLNRLTADNYRQSPVRPDGPGSRTAYSNAAAIAKTRQNY